MRRVTNVENWDKKDRELHLPVFWTSPASMGTFHTVHFAEQLDARECKDQRLPTKHLGGSREQVHGLGSAVLERTCCALLDPGGPGDWFH